MVSSSLETSFQVVNRFRPDLNIKSKTINTGLEVFMSSLIVILLSLVLVSCSSFQGRNSGNHESLGYQHGKQMDEKSLRASFLAR